MDFEEELAEADKTRIRLEARAARDDMPEALRAAKNEAIAANLTKLPEFMSARAVMAYIAFGSEADTEPAIAEAAARGKRVMVPDHFGIIEVTGSFARRADASEIDLVLVPGLAFDENGYRLGYGSGWYDTFASKLREGVKLAGIAYEEQVARSLPTEPHDLHLNLIVTDKRTIRPA